MYLSFINVFIQGVSQKRGRCVVPQKRGQSDFPKKKGSGRNHHVNMSFLSFFFYFFRTLEIRRFPNFFVFQSQTFFVKNECFFGDDFLKRKNKQRRYTQAKIGVIRNWGENEIP